MVPGTERHQMGVVSWRRYRNRPGATHIRVTQLVRKTLQLVRVEVRVVPEDVIVTGPRRALNTLMAAQIEIELRRVGDAYVDGRARRNVAAFARLFLLVGAEETRVMALLYDDKCDARLVVALQFDAGLADRRQFVLEQLQELTFGNAVAIQDDAVGFVTAGRFVEHNQQFADHRTQFLYDLLAVLLNAHRGGVTRRMRVH